MNDLIYIFLLRINIVHNTIYLYCVCCSISTISEDARLYPKLVMSMLQYAPRMEYLTSLIITCGRLNEFYGLWFA